MKDPQNLIVFAIFAGALGWLIWKFTRPKKGCGSCDCDHPPKEKKDE